MFYIVVLLALPLLQQVSAVQCGLDSYDFSSLRKPDGQFYELPGRVTLRWGANPCGDVVCPRNPDVRAPGMFLRSDNFCEPYGNPIQNETGVTWYYIADGVAVNYTGGKTAYGGQNTAVFEFQCDESTQLQLPDRVDNKGAPPDVIWFRVLRTKLACSKVKWFVPQIILKSFFSAFGVSDKEYEAKVPDSLPYLDRVGLAWTYRQCMNKRPGTLPIDKPVPPELVFQSLSVWYMAAHYFGDPFLKVAILLQNPDMIGKLRLFKEYVPYAPQSQVDACLWRSPQFDDAVQRFEAVYSTVTVNPSPDYIAKLGLSLADLYKAIFPCITPTPTSSGRKSTQEKNNASS